MQLQSRAADQGRECQRDHGRKFESGYPGARDRRNAFDCWFVRGINSGFEYRQSGTVCHIWIGADVSHGNHPATVQRLPAPVCASGRRFCGFPLWVIPEAAKGSVSHKGSLSAYF